LLLGGGGEREECDERDSQHDLTLPTLLGTQPGRFYAYNLLAMKMTPPLIALLLACGLSFVGGRVSAQQAAPKVFPPLERFLGDYEVEGKFWMQPGQPPVVSKGTAQFTPVLLGRFVRQDYKASLGGMSIEGVGYYGFDPATQNYSSVWMYNLDARMDVRAGQMDEKGVLLLRGEARGGLKSEQTIRWANDDERVVTSILVRPDGARAKMYEITYKRKTK
jgi:hypothetical protein